MTPLQITAKLSGQIMCPESCHLDGLLAYALAQTHGLPPVHVSDDRDRDLSFLIAKVSEVLKHDERGFFHCSNPMFEVEQYERRHINRRFPTDRAVVLGADSVRRVELSTGLSKSFRIPTRACFLRGDEVRWCALGEQSHLERLLGTITHLGKKRAVGLGGVSSWSVTECEGWEHFPILSKDGRPMRSVPIDTPGLTSYRTSLELLCFPYWETSKRRPCAV